MPKLRTHLRNTFLAGVFAAIPIAVTAFVVWYVDNVTSAITRRLFGHYIPFLGVAIAVVAIYWLGLFVTSVIGRWLIAQLDRLLLRVPVLNELYKAWKHVSVTPGGREGIFARVVLIPDDATRGWMLGFSSGEPIDGDPATCCVFVPAAPNPANGRLYFTRVADVRTLDIGAEEAFKLILSGGNYVPPEIGAATRGAIATMRT